MLDLTQLLPHCKKDAKLDTKTDKGVINEVADMKVPVSTSPAPLAYITDVTDSSFMSTPGTPHRSAYMSTSDTQSCRNVMFFEARKKQDLYLWLAKAPEGPSVKFLALNGDSLCSCPVTGGSGTFNCWGILVNQIRLDECPAFRA